jgi:hypothetical protein
MPKANDAKIIPKSRKTINFYLSPSGYCCINESVPLTLVSNIIGCDVIEQQIKGGR